MLEKYFLAVLTSLRLGVFLYHLLLLCGAGFENFICRIVLQPWCRDVSEKSMGEETYTGRPKVIFSLLPVAACFAIVVDRELSK